MRIVLAFLLCFSCSAFAQEVARVFGAPVTRTEIGLADSKTLPQAARQLRERALKDAVPRFIAANRLQATDEEIAGYQRWEAEFRRIDLKRRAQRLAEVESELAQPALEEKKRKPLEEQRDVLRSLAKHDAERPVDPSGGARVHAQWIEGYKLKKALYEKYGGRVGITKWGPDPAGATEALLREHEKRRELIILDAALAQAFWDALAKEPRFPAKPEDIDFTYYWLKPPK